MTGPRIAIDHSAGFNQGAGIGRYARNLVPELVREMPGASFTLWYAPEPGRGAVFAEQAMAPFEGLARVKVRSCRFDRRRIDQLWFRARAPLPIELWTGRNDLVYSPDFTAPPSLRTPNIITIHDIAFSIVPERAPAGLRNYLTSVVPRAARNAAAIVAVSETTKRDIVERLRIPADRVTVVPNAAGERFFAAEPLTEVERKRLGLPQRYFLTVGTLEPRKNHQTLFAALRMLSGHLAIPLVVAGRVGWCADGIIASSKELEREGMVIRLDYVDDSLLPGLYACAEALIYPSWYEGFGLPVLEGMASGTRVIASDIPAHREISDGTVEFIDPGDVASIAAALESAANNPDDEFSRSRRVARARFYSWSESAKTLARLVEKVGAA